MKAVCKSFTYAVSALHTRIQQVQTTLRNFMVQSRCLFFHADTDKLNVLTFDEINTVKVDHWTC